MTLTINESLAWLILAIVLPPIIIQIAVKLFIMKGGKS